MTLSEQEIQTHARVLADLLERKNTTAEAIAEALKSPPTLENHARVVRLNDELSDVIWDVLRLAAEVEPRSPGAARVMVTKIEATIDFRDDLDAMLPGYLAWAQEREA